MIYLNQKPSKGDKISYQRKIMFKGFETVTVKIVAVFSNNILLENGDSLMYIIN